MPSPQRFTQHAARQALIQFWLMTYALRHPGVNASGPVTLILGPRDEPEPDAVLFGESRAIIDPDGYLRGAPDLVVEVAASSQSRDYHQKMRVYAAAGIPEYLIWNVRDGVFDCFSLRDGRYERRPPNPDGTIESGLFPGLLLDTRAALAGDVPSVAAAVR